MHYLNASDGINADRVYAKVIIVIDKLIKDVKSLFERQQYKTAVIKLIDK